MVLKRWTEEEINVLQQNYNKPTKELMNLLPYRTKKSIQIKMDKIGLTKVKNKTKNTGTHNKAISKKPSNSKKRINWTKEDVDILLSSETLEEALKRLPHCSEKRILYKMYKLKKTFSNRSWSNEEETILKKYYIIGEMQKVQELLPNRTLSAIHSRAYILNLKYPSLFELHGDTILNMYQKGMYPAEIGRIFNVRGLSIIKGLRKSSDIKYKRVVLKGKRHPGWIGHRTENDLARRSEEYKIWRQRVFERDRYTCVCCSQSARRSFEAHHIENFSTNIEKRFSVENGVTLCLDCHSTKCKDSFHLIYGTRNNNIEQLQEYIDNKRTKLNLNLFPIEEYLKGIKGGNKKDA